MRIYVCGVYRVCTHVFVVYGACERVRELGERAALQNETVRTCADIGAPRASRQAASVESCLHAHRPQVLLWPEHPPTQLLNLLRPKCIAPASYQPVPHSVSEWVVLSASRSCVIQLLSGTHTDGPCCVVFPQVFVSEGSAHSFLPFPTTNSREAVVSLLVFSLLSLVLRSPHGDMCCDAVGCYMCQFGISEFWVFW